MGLAGWWARIRSAGPAAPASPVAPAVPAGPAPAFCTLATRQFIPHVHALLESLAAAEPGAPRMFLFISETAGDARKPAWPGVQVLRVGDIVDAATERMLRRRYTVGEFCFALKPYLLRHLLKKHPRVAYLDSDTVVHAPLLKVREALDRSFAVLTPHLDAPFPDDGLRPTDLTLLRAGLYNLGFIALAAGARAGEMLDWWQRRSTRWGFVAPHLGYVGDQRWMDLAPVFFPDIAILRDPGYNFAYWNFHSRLGQLSADGRDFQGSPLAFVHFSGFDAARPEQVSRYQNRYTLESHPALAALFRDYARRLEAGRAFAGTLQAATEPVEPPEGPHAPHVAQALMADDAYRAEIVPAPFPGDIDFSEEVVVAVRVRNASPHAWRVGTDAQGQGGVALTYHLYWESGAVMAYDNTRFPLTRDLAPGEAETVEVALRAPAGPGHFVVEFDLVHEGLTWFATRGSATPRVWLTVGDHPKPEGTPA